MKKTITLVSMILALLLFSACNKNAEVKQFMTDFSDAVDKNDRAAIEKMYPEMAKADSLSVNFDAETAQIEEQEDGSYKVILGEGKDIILVKNEGDGIIKVKESHGILAVPEAEKDFALKTGLIKKEMNDAAVIKQLADSAFVTYVSGEFMKSFHKNFRISKIWDDRSNNASDWTGGGEWFITVKNDCDFDIAGSDYRVTMASPVQRGKVVVMEGKDIFAGNTVELKSGYQSDKFYVDYSECIDPKEPKISLDLNISDMELLGKYFVPKGNEYENYLKTKQ